MLASIGGFLENLLTSPAFLEVLATAVAVIWALPRLQQWREGVRRTRWDRALQLGVRAATETYVQYVQGLKRGREDGHLTEGEVTEARRRATARLKELMRAEGPELLRFYGEDALEWVIELAVGRLRRKEVQ